MAWLGLLIAVALAAYAIGTFPTARLVGHSIGKDPTKEGSGNPGASNVYRIAGRWPGLIVLLADMAKGAIPTFLALHIFDRPEALAAWLGAVVGHIWPLGPRLFRRGGKGAATCGGGAMVLDPFTGLICLAAFGIVVRVTKKAAIGTLMIAVLYPTLVAALIPLWPDWTWQGVVVAMLVMALVVLRHHSNISRLWKGTELKVRS